MLKSKKLLGVMSWFICLSVQAQPDTIVAYDIATMETTLIPPIVYDTSLTTDSTSSFVGYTGSPVTLNLAPPTSNLFPGSEFSNIEPAALFFDPAQYPASAAAALRVTDNGITKHRCSCLMVGPRTAITAAHCVYNLVTHDFASEDTVEVIPAWNNGHEQPGLLPSKIKKYYIFKTYYDQTHWDDVALMELSDPIGLQTGWLGMAYNTDAGYFTGKVFHKFSYPGVISPCDSTVYNGDTMYYNYGMIDTPTTTPENLFVTGGCGVPGQSGSSLCYINNASIYHTYAVLNFSSNYNHYRLRPATFYQLVNILNNYTNGITESGSSQNLHVIVYPLPFGENATLEFENPGAEKFRLYIYNSSGSLVQLIENIQGNRVNISRNQMPGGIYLYRLANANGPVASGKMVVE